MAFNAEAVAKLRLDTSEFQRGLTRTVAQVGEAGDDINKKLNRAFGAGDAFKAFLGGLGIGTVERLADTLTKSFEKASESAKEIAEQTAKTLGIYQEIYKSRRTDGQNLEKNIEDQARLQRELKQINDPKRREFTVYEPNQTQKTLVRDLTDDETKRVRDIESELAGLAKEEDALRKKIKESKQRDQEESQKRSDDLAAREEKLALNKLSIEQRISALEQKRFDLLSKDPGQSDLANREAVMAITEELDALEQKKAEDEKKSLEELTKSEQELGRLREENASQAMETEQQISALRAKQLELDAQSLMNGDRMNENAIEREKIEGRILALQKKQKDNNQKIFDEAAKLYKQRSDAKADLSGALSGQAQTLRDRSSFSLDDAASGKFGNPTVRMQSRRVRQLEDRAKRIRGMGRLEDNGKVLDNAKVADDLISQADKIRGGIKGLNSADADPMRGVAEKVSTCAEKLSEIQQQLDVMGNG